MRSHTNLLKTKHSQPLSPSPADVLHSFHKPCPLLDTLQYLLVLFQLGNRTGHGSGGVASPVPSTGEESLPCSAGHHSRHRPGATGVLGHLGMCWLMFSTPRSFFCEAPLHPLVPAMLPAGEVTQRKG